MNHVFHTNIIFKPKNLLLDSQKKSRSVPEAYTYKKYPKRYTQGAGENRPISR